MFSYINNNDLVFLGGDETKSEAPYHLGTPVIVLRTVTTVLPCKSSVTTKGREGRGVVAVEIIVKIFLVVSISLQN